MEFDKVCGDCHNDTFKVSYDDEDKDREYVLICTKCGDVWEFEDLITRH